MEPDSCWSRRSCSTAAFIQSPLLVLTERRHRAQLVKVALVHHPDGVVDGQNPAGSVDDVVVKLSVGEAQVVLIGFAAQAICWGLVHQLSWNRQLVSNLTHLMNHEICQGAEVTSAVAELGGVAHIILGHIAGVGHSSAVGQRLRNGIERRHTEPGREVDLGLLADAILKPGAHSRHQLAVCAADVDSYA